MDYCRCLNTCTRIAKRGFCPCRRDGRDCTDLCLCRSSVGCMNRRSVQPPASPPPHGLISDLAALDSSRENLVSSEDDWEKQLKETVSPETPVAKAVPRKRKATKSKGGDRKRAKRRLDVSETETQEPAGDLSSAMESHQRSVNDFVKGLSMQELQSVAIELLLRDQTAYQDYVLGYRPEMPEDPPSPDPSHPQPDDAPAWCRCGNCRPMPTQVENKCCQMTRNCFINTPGMIHVWTPSILDIANAAYNDIMVLDQERDNRSMRFAAYRQYILMRHGHCGHGNRHVVPSCVTLAIRRRYPDPTGTYTGFSFAH